MMRFMILLMLCFLISCSEQDIHESALSFKLVKGKVTASFAHAPLHDVAKLVADQAHVVIRISPNVSGEVNASFDQVPLNIALQSIFKPFGASFVYAGKLEKHVRELVLLNEGEDVSVATVFVPKAVVGSLLSRAIQTNRADNVRINDVKQNAPSLAQPRNAMNQRIAVLRTEINKLNQQKIVALQQNRDVSGLNAKLEALQREANVVGQNLHHASQSSIYNRQQIEHQRRSL